MRGPILPPEVRLRESRHSVWIWAMLKAPELNSCMIFSTNALSWGVSVGRSEGGGLPKSYHAGVP